MSTDRYFDKFPIIQYGNSTVNTTAVDITARVVVDSVVYSSPYVFYPYDLSEGERADQFSNRYYSDSYKSWILYLTNKIVDPYYNWYMQQSELDNFIIDKYGSIENAINKTAYYVNNWTNADPINVNYYDSLPSVLQDYWSPNYDNNGNVISYVRKQQNWKVTTNKVYSYVVSNTSFIYDEICTVNFDTNTGQGQVLAFDPSTNTVILQHTSGVMANTNSVIKYIYGTESGVNTSIISANLVANNISDIETIYWTPVTYYDDENAKNEFNKSIIVLDNRFVPTAVNNLKTLLSNN